jgi:hypothetical protein
MGHEGLFKATRGKFENKATKMLYDMSLDGGGDEECGEVDRGGWFGLMRGPFNDDKGNEIPGLGSYVGAILQQTNEGFAYSEFFTSQKKLDAQWKKVCEEAELYGEGD